MEPTRETDRGITTLTRRYEILQQAVTLTRKEQEDWLRSAAWEEDWEEVLCLLDFLGEGLSREILEPCTLLAVQNAPCEVVGSLLELLPPGEHTGGDSYPVNWSPTGEVCRRLKWEVHVQGTLTMHAVAKNRPDVLQLLLDRGYDPNCASVGAAAALLRDYSEHVTCYGLPFLPFHPYTARPESCVQLLAWDTTPDDIPPMEWEGCTPLALALLLGHPQCARILLEQGAWLEEAPYVSAAMHLFWRENDPEYQAARAAVLRAGDHARHRPVLWAAGKTCSPRQLEAILEAWHYEKDELAQGAAVMTQTQDHQQPLWKNPTDGWQDLCRRLCCIGRVCPEALRDRGVIGSLLGILFGWKKVEMDPLLPFWEGSVLDISELERSVLYHLDRPGSRKHFTRLAEHCQLVMDRDAVPTGISEGVLRLLLRHVSFLPSQADRGVSPLTKGILRTGDLRLIRSALNNGLIPPEESTEELLRCQQALRLPPVCRSALLTTPRKKGVPCREAPRGTGLHEHWFGILFPPETMPILDEEDWARWLWPTLHHPFGYRRIPLLGEEWQLHKTFFAACLEGRTDVVEAMLPWMDPRELRNTESMQCVEKGLCITMTPLCAAALGGRREIAELLLDRGAPLREDLWGRPSTWIGGWATGDREYILPFDPVLAAALGGHRDMVEYLLSRGGVWEGDAPEARPIWKELHREVPEENIGSTQLL